MQRLNESAKTQAQAEKSPSPPTEWLEELEAAANSRPESSESPEMYVDPDLPAHHRLAAWQDHYVARYGHKEEVCNPLKLVPNRPCKDDGGLGEIMYVLNWHTFCGRPLAWAMKQDPTAVEEIFALVKPYALWIFVPSLENPNWWKAIPDVARKKIVKLCVIEREKTQLKTLRALLPRTYDLENLQAVEFFVKPRLVSERGRQTRKFPFAHAVEYGMKPNIRLFFRFAFAEDAHVHGEDRNRRVKQVTEFVRESAPGGIDPPVVTKEAAVEYPQFTYETFDKEALCSPHVFYEDYNPYLAGPG